MLKTKNMDMEKRYKLPNDNGEATGMVAEPIPAAGMSLSVQEMRHHLIDAVNSSKDVEKLYTCLVILNSKSTAGYRSKYREKTDEELAAELSQFPFWDEIDHPDLSSVDYRQYTHRKSAKTLKATSK